MCFSSVLKCSSPSPILKIYKCVLVIMSLNCKIYGLNGILLTNKNMCLSDLILCVLMILCVYVFIRYDFLYMYVHHI